MELERIYKYTKYMLWAVVAMLLTWPISGFFCFAAAVAVVVFASLIINIAGSVATITKEDEVRWRVDAAIRDFFGNIARYVSKCMVYLLGKV